MTTIVLTFFAIGDTIYCNIGSAVLCVSPEVMRMPLKTYKKKRLRILALIAVLFILLVTLSCGGGANPDPQPSSGIGKVALFITDNISFYKQVISTITAVRLVNSGTGDICKVLHNPLTLDIANLKNLAHYSGLAECAAGKYNRIDIDFQKSVVLMDQLDTASACAYTSYLNDNDETKPLTCDQDTGICTLSIRGGARDGSVTVQEDQYNDLGIDFDLKQFTVADFGNSVACSITMKAAAMSAVDMNSSGRSHEVTGRIQDLATAAETFTLITGSVSLTVDYSGINPALQKNIDLLLLTAQTGSLPVIVQTGDIAVETGTIPANRIFMKAAGTVSGVKENPQWSFVLNYQPSKTLAGSHKPPAVIEGAFVDGAWVNVRFDGYDAVNAEYLAVSVEVLPAGMIIDD
jgi:hypothetical protein